MKFIIAVLCLVATQHLLSQGEEVGPLSTNPYLLANPKEKAIALEKSNPGTFDSTFVYLPDTLNLPFFDEFSTDKFQRYDFEVNDPGVTSEQNYKLIYNSTLLPVPANLTFTTTTTYRRTVAVDNITHVDTPLPGTSLQIGNLSSYPVNYVSTTAYPPYYLYDSLGKPGDITDTVWIFTPDIIQDSARIFFAALNDDQALWLDSYAYHNYRYAINPWSIGVATFDGLDQNGKAYALGSTLPNYADFLTSKPLDLTPYTASDSVYFSFLYQAGGLGDEPEAADSLVLEFYSKDLDQWNWVWSTGGFNSTDFKFGHIVLKNAQYFKKGFQFRFKNYGNRAGGFDHFHLDYVNLRALSGYQDTLFKDFAWVYPIGSLLQDFTSVPWDHFKNNPSGKNNTNVNLTIRNGSNLPENNSIAGKVTINYNGTEEESITIQGSSLANGALNYAPRTSYSSVHDFSVMNGFDETKPGYKQTFDLKGTIEAQFPNFTQNDTTYSTQYFANYYSYDDGSAEAAYGTTGAQSMMAVKFTPYEADSVLGIMTQFVESATNVSNKLFLLTVWSDNNGRPGTILYQDDNFFPRTPQYNYGLNNYYTYYFKDTAKIAVSGSFYIGWRQFDAERLNLGFDKNNINNDKVLYSLDYGLTWNGSSVEGTPMIRPVFSTAMDFQLGIPHKEAAETRLQLYPNPTSDILHIRNTSSNYKGIELYNMQGISVLYTQDLEVDLSTLPAGIYFVKPLNNTNTTYKVTKY